jgi:hypothetical protein
MTEDHASRPESESESESAPERAVWSPMTRFLFRFGFVYCLLFCVPMMLGYYPGLTATPAQHKAFGERQKARAATRTAPSRPASAASSPASAAASRSAASQRVGDEEEEDDDAPNVVVRLTGELLAPYYKQRRKAIELVGVEVLGLSKEQIPFQPTGSGDTMQNYVAALINGSVAFVGAILWSLLAFGATAHPHAAGFLQWLVRWFLFMVMVPWYGFAKVIPTQFSPPGLHQLAMSWEDSSMMGVVWRFMGLSMPYTVFSGIAELLGGLLLMWRRTTTLGALVIVAVMANVTALNCCYDVPVKLHSLHYLVMAFGLLIPDLRRLCDVFVRNRPVPARRLRPFLGSVAADRCFTVFKLVLVAWLCHIDVHKRLESRQLAEERRANTLAGVHQVESFTRGGVEVPPLTTDTARWQTLIVEWKGSASVRMSSGALVRIGFTPDPAKGTVAIALPAPGPTRFRRASLSYAEPEPGVLELSGTLDDTPVTMRLRKREAGKVEPYTLHDRGFRWICELPFNR